VNFGTFEWFIYELVNISGFFLHLFNLEPNTKEWLKYY